MEARRPPDERFAGLPGYPWTPAFREWEGLRLAHLDEGAGPPVVFVHGEPTWSYLWRKVIPPVLDAGFRCLAPDLPGFGRSDKPADVGWYSYDRMTASLVALLDELELVGATMVVHDWGGPIGLRAAVERVEWVDRLVIMDTGMFTGRQRMSEGWMTFRAFVERTEDLPVSLLVRRGCHTDPGDEVAAAYDAPFPDPADKAGARALPLLVPLDTDHPTASGGQRAFDALREDRRDTLMLWADADPVLPLETGRRFAEAIGRPAPEVVEGAGHFLQEDAGERIGERIAGWLRVG